ncbi:nuclear transport factor 2 family protein [Terribacillus sp. 7520-G]|uniref:nuclear transport factor 2 family protein n=1 Tax=Terribacillus TaxID=459532 RepID=UPI0013045FC7|nr:nuclear transport factor 2 family protein [Terribacillus sp. 7520-G]
MAETQITLSTGEKIVTQASERQILQHITNNQGMINKAFIVIGDVHIATAHIVKVESLEQPDTMGELYQDQQAVETESAYPSDQAGETGGQEQFELLEQELREAMQTRDIFLLDTLLHDELVSINHEGSQITKEMHLEAHRTLAVRFTEVSCKDLQIKPTKDGAVTISQIHLKGEAGDEKIDGDYIHTRVWQLIGDQYQVIAGHCSRL